MVFLDLLCVPAGGRHFGTGPRALSTGLALALSLSLSLSLDQIIISLSHVERGRSADRSSACVGSRTSGWRSTKKRKSEINRNQPPPPPPLCPIKKLKDREKKTINADRLVTDRLPSFSLFCCPFFQKKMVKASQKWLQYLATLHAPIFPFFFVRFNGHFLSFFTTRIS